MTTIKILFTSPLVRRSYITCAEKYRLLCDKEIMSGNTTDAKYIGPIKYRLIDFKSALTYIDNNIDETDSIEMLNQHLILRPIEEEQTKAAIWTSPLNSSSSGSVIAMLKLYPTVLHLKFTIDKMHGNDYDVKSPGQHKNQSKRDCSFKYGRHPKQIRLPVVIDLTLDDDDDDESPPPICDESPPLDDLPPPLESPPLDETPPPLDDEQRRANTARKSLRFRPLDDFSSTEREWSMDVEYDSNVEEEEELDPNMDVNAICEQFDEVTTAIQLSSPQLPSSFESCPLGTIPTEELFPFAEEVWTNVSFVF